MSEKLLKAIIQLLAIVAKEDQVTSDERASIEKFLLESLNSEEAKRYLALFDVIVSQSTIVFDEKQEIKRITDQINKELTKQQKVVVILDLLELIIADGRISKRENELVYLIARSINIPKEITDHLKSFVLYQDRSKMISSNILIVDNGKYERNETSKYITRENLKGIIFILHTKELDTYFIKYIGEEGIFLNGNPLRHNRIKVFSSGSSVRGSTLEPLYYSDVASEFRDVDAEEHISLIASDISYKFPNGNIGLRNINIVEHTGKLIAIMGGSGAGKSTLLNVLNGIDSPSEGSVRINGIDIHQSKENIEGVIGFVPQDDLLIEDLTVYQNLYFAAKLCFKDKSNQELDRLIVKTLESLGLIEIKSLKVGNPLEKVISGGQRKRLNIGLELLREPAVLFVDEPTSGLSSSDSENIMDLLRELTLKGKLIFSVIHQPSEDIFRMFDKLVILDVGGYQIYYGNPVNAIDYFRGIVKIVDKRTNDNPEQIFNIIEAKVVNEYGHVTKQRKISPYEWYTAFKERIKIPQKKEFSTAPKKTLNIPNRFKQIPIFTIRDVLSKLNNRQYLYINFLEAPVLAFILAFIVRYTPADKEFYTFKENLNIPVFFFMSVIVALFMGLTVSAEEILKDKKIKKREAFLNLSKFSYIISKLTILFTLSAIQTLTYVIIGAIILEIKGMTLEMWLVLFSISCFANTLGLNISASFKSAVTVYILIPLLVIPQLLLSGVVVNFDKLNPTISAADKVPFIGELMASRWAFESLCVTQFRDNAYEDKIYPHDKIMANSEYKTVYHLPRLDAALDYLHRNIDSESTNQKRIESNLAILRNEINKELIAIGKDKFPQVDKLTKDEFNDVLYNQTKQFLGNLRKFYNNKYKKADRLKSEVLSEYTETEKGRETLIQLRNTYENERLSSIVKNTSTELRLIERDNELIQKIYPIYMDPQFPENIFDFREQFYVPEKQFFGAYFDTFYFNILVIWSMSFVLIIFLYYDVLKKILTGFKR